MDPISSIAQLLDSQSSKILQNSSRENLIHHVLEQKWAQETPSGALITWNEAKSTGRSPADTYIVRHPESEGNIDWNSPTNKPLDPALFDELWKEAFEMLEKKEQLYVSDYAIGADEKFALPTKFISDNPLSTLFVDNMFRPALADKTKSIFGNEEFTLVSIPHDKIASKNYDSDMIIAMDFDRKLGLVYGSSYCGSMKKLMFTVMNYMTPEKGILPLHCSANVGNDGNSALILGLSGTGKTTLSADASRPLIGDDEHGWSDDGVANFEGGCYAKLINLNPKKEPEIYRITFGEKKNVTDNGVIIENAMMYPNGKFDLDDKRFTPNSRVSYPLSALQNIQEGSVSDHPKSILFLTADANGILPPVSKLSPDQAMLWFLMGYTSKLAGTETGITEPKTTFSRFFGGPFMPRNPNDYTDLLNTKITQHDVNVYLINTGWTGGPYGVGKRIDIMVTRAIVNACLNGDLEGAEYEDDERFHISVPKSCPEVASEILDPRNTWENKDEYEERANKLSHEFSDYFDKTFGNVNDAVRNQCPGK
jgi:phosphoenolpyruvate carboxykinase (ATP)